VVESWPARLVGERTAGVVGPRARRKRPSNGGSELLIFDRRVAPGRDCWCCESHATSCPAPPVEATVTRPAQQAGLRSSLGRSTFHCINMNYGPTA
jgi:hypothetical protein